MNTNSDQLRDIHLPDPISWWPPAPGWWLLLLLLASLGLFIWWHWRRHQRGRMLRSALAELQKIQQHYQQSGDARILAQQLSILLRRISVSLYPRNEVAGIIGEDWLIWLDEALGKDEFQHGVGRALIEAPYTRQMNFDATALIRLCERWLRQTTTPRGLRP